MLIDAGIGPRVAGKRLAALGANLAEVSCILLTHLDADHCRREWKAWVVRHGVRLFCHQERRHDLARGDAELLTHIRTFHDRPFEPMPGITVDPLRFSHDQEGSHGFVIDVGASRLGYATDLGQVPRLLIDRFCGLNILAIESNYEPELQLQSARPEFLKRRIMGGRGHLSNQQAFAALRSVFDHADARDMPYPEHVVLLHRSRHCNCPHRVRALFSQDARIAPCLTLAEQDHHTAWLGTSPAPSRRAGQQLRFAFA